jgi:outer membrane receptor protein involved in Fe transport
VQDYRAWATITNKQDIETQEIRLQSTDPASKLKWTIGAFWSLSRGVSVEENHEPQIAEIYQGVFGIDYRTAYGGFELLPNGDSYILTNIGHDRQLAGFGEATYSITDALKLTAGARVSRTKFDFSSLGDGPHDFGPYALDGGTQETPFTPKLGLSWQIDPNNLLYATYAKGFRIGGANAPVVKDCTEDLDNLGIGGAPTTYKSDTVQSYEVGAKNNIAERVRLASSVFYIKWNGIQQNVYLPGCGLQFTGNFGQAVAKGFDLQADFALFSSLSFDTAIGYTNARFTADSPGGITRDGDAISGAPAPWTASAGMQYDFTLAERPSFVRFDYQYERRNRWLTASRDPQASSFDPYSVATPTTHFASLRAGTSFGGWQVSLFVDNLFDAQTVFSRAHSDLDFTVADDVRPAPLQYGYAVFRPRMIGLNVALRQ